MAITVVATIPTQQRQPDNPWESTDVVVPVDAVGFARIIADMNDTDYLDPTHTLVISIRERRAGVVDPVDIAGLTWTGGPVTDPELGVNPRPFTDIGLLQYRGRTLFARIQTNVRFRVGARLETSPDPFW